MASSDLCSLIFSPVCADLSLWREGVKNFLGFADDVWSSWVEGVWCMWGGGVCEMRVLYNNVSR